MFSKQKHLLYSLLTALFIGILFPLLNYTGKEGFNPSDDGVILAQSWRIINGEVPHKDFVAMKPVMSGFLHIINFYLPLKLEDNARWFVVFQNFLFSFLWVILLFRIFIPAYRTGLLFISVLLISFILNLNHHGLFPWTTVDGLFWSIIGITIFFFQFEENHHHYRRFAATFLGIFFLSLAFLSRQSFIFPLLFLDLLVLVQFLKFKKKFALLLVSFLGHLPIFIYLFYLWKNDAIALFFSQMSGRTELLQVGVFQYVKSFIKSRLVLINLTVLAFIFWYIVAKIRLKKTDAASDILSKYSLLISSMALLWLLLCLSLSVNMLIIPDPMNQANPFELFFITISITFFALAFIPMNFKQKALLCMGLIVVWTSSLSLGSNSPVYCLGIVISMEIILSLYILSSLNFKPFAETIEKAGIVMFAFSIFVFFIGIWTQQKMNYRDKSAEELDCRLGNIIPSFGSTRTNSNLCNYYSEFIRIYNSIPEMKDHFVLLPNNAMIYPIMQSKNPFPVDWAQHDEYIGQEKLVENKIRKVLQKEKLFILVDRYNIETIADGLTAVDYFNYSVDTKHDLFIKKYKVAKYEYLSLISEYCKEIPANYRYFKLYVTRQNN